MVAALARALGLQADQAQRVRRSVSSSRGSANIQTILRAKRSSQVLSITSPCHNLE